MHTHGSEIKLGLYPLAESVTFEVASQLGETRSWQELTEVERIGFEVAEIISHPTWVNNFPLFLISAYRFEDPIEDFKKLYGDIDDCVQRLGFAHEEIDAYRFAVGGDTICNELMKRFGVTIYREMRLLGYDAAALRA